MTLKPIVLYRETGTQTKTWTWTVTLKDNRGATASRSFTVIYKPIQPQKQLTFTNLQPSLIETRDAPYDATLTATGSNFLNVNQIMFSWSGAVSGNATWNKGDSRWNAGVTVHSDSLMTLRPRVVETNPTWSGTVTWTVTLRDTTGATASRSFTVTYVTYTINKPTPISPGEPLGSSHSPIPPGSVTFRWNKNNVGATYRLYVRDITGYDDFVGVDMGELVINGLDVGDKDTYTWSDAEPGKKYRWQVEAVKGGSSALSDRLVFVTTKDSKIVVNLPVPYIHQCYDTPDGPPDSDPNNDPDYFDGRWACGATSAVMILAYYGKLSPWPDSVALPQPHTSNYGNYVCRRYTYGSYTFNIATPQPSGDPPTLSGPPAYGAYGYIHNPDGLARPEKVVDYFQKHGLDAQVDYTPTEQEIKAALDAGKPVWASTALTSSGHIVVIKGYTSDGFYIVNDPFGSKPYASPIWGDYDGADVKYSWSEMGIGGKWIVVPGPSISPGPVVDKSLSLSYEGGRFSLKVFNVDDMARVEVNGTQLVEVGYYQEKEVDLSPYLKAGENEILLTVRNNMYGWTYGFALYKDGQEIWRDQDGTVGVRGARNDDRTLGIVYQCRIKLALGPKEVTLTLYVHEGNPSGPLLSGVRVTGNDAAGKSFDKTTDGGYVAITGAPGTWSFTVSKEGYGPKSWSQPITATDRKDAFIFKITAAISEELLREIDSLAGQYYDDNWGLTLDQYKAWIATIAWGEGGREGGYVAHSHYALGKDVFNHKGVGSRFIFSTGIGPFQLDNGGIDHWERWPTIKKLDWREAVKSVFKEHYESFKGKGQKIALQDFASWSPWNAVNPNKGGNPTERWKEVTGTDWEDHKNSDKKRNPPPLNWNDPSKPLPPVSPTLAKNAEGIPGWNYRESVQYLGYIQWDIREEDGYTTDLPSNKKIVFTGPLPTWRIRTQLFSYYYTLANGIEVWVWDNADDPNYRFQYAFFREYVTGQYPEGRINNTTAGAILKRPAINLTPSTPPGVMPSASIVAASTTYAARDPKAGLVWKKGQRLVMKVHARNLFDCAGSILVIRYDPSILRVEGVDGGAKFGKPTYEDDGKGTLKISVSVPEKGKGIILKKYYGKAVGATLPDGTKVPADQVKAGMKVDDPPAGDGKWDIYELRMLATQWGWDWKVLRAPDVGTVDAEGKFLSPVFRDIGLKADRSRVAVGDTVNVELLVDAAGMTAGRVVLKYDPSKLQFVGSVAGEMPFVYVAPGAGTITVDFAPMGGAVGKVASFTFKAIGAGYPGLKVDSSVMWDMTGKEVLDLLPRRIS
jgi:hypothetical protein